MLIVTDGRPQEIWAVRVGTDPSVPSAYLCATQKQAQRLALAYREQHGAPARVVLVTVTASEEQTA